MVAELRSVRGKIIAIFNSAMILCQEITGTTHQFFALVALSVNRLFIRAMQNAGCWENLPYSAITLSYL